MNTSKLFFAGVPTGPDVDKLRAKFGAPEIGALLTYSAIANVVCVDLGSPRFRTIITAWRKALEREHDILLEAVPCEGFRVMSARDKVHFTAKKQKEGVREITRAVHRAAKIPMHELSPEDQRLAAKVVSVGTAIHLAAVTTAKQLDYRKALNAGKK